MNKPTQGFFLIALAMLLLTACASTKNNSKSTEVASPQHTRLAVDEQRKFDYFFLEAIKEKALGHYDKAFQLFGHALDIDAQSPEALYEISQYYLFLKQTEKGVRLLEEAVAYAPQNYFYRQGLANVYRQIGNSDKAIEQWETMSVMFPTREEPLLALLNRYAATDDYDGQLSVLYRLECLTGKSEQISMEKFKIYIMQEDSKKAFEEIDMLIEEYPMELRYQLMKGDLYMENDRIEEAKAEFDRVLSTEPNNAMAQISMASYYEAMNDTTAYYAQVHTILLNKEMPTEFKASFLQKLVTEQEEKSESSTTEMIALFEDIIALDTEDVDIPLLYAQYLLMKGMEEESIPVLEQVLRLTPTNTGARVTLLGIAIRKNNLDLVERICKAGTEASPEVMEFYFYLGYAYFMQDKLEDALATYEKTIELFEGKTEPNMTSDIYSMIGDVLHSLKRSEDAFQAYEKALEYNASNVGALNNYAYYLSLERRNLDRAEEMSYKTVKAEPNNSTYLDTYAWILFEKGDYVQARLFIDDALKNNSDSSGVITEHAGDIYFMNGDTDGAVELWKQAREQGSDSVMLDEKIKKRKYIAEPKK